MASFVNRDTGQPDGGGKAEPARGRGGNFDRRQVKPIGLSQQCDAVILELEKPLQFLFRRERQPGSIRFGRAKALFDRRFE